MSSPVTTIAEIGKHEGQSVTIRGWLYNLRESGKLLFPQFRDGSGDATVVGAKHTAISRAHVICVALAGYADYGDHASAGNCRADLTKADPLAHFHGQSSTPLIVAFWTGLVGERHFQLS